MNQIRLIPSDRSRRLARTWRVWIWPTKPERSSPGGGKIFENPTLELIDRKRGLIQEDVTAIPKTTSRERMEENPPSST